ncbi:MAG: YicC family protein [candidate division Zixibacteria bacterium]|nr:YicC family protein [candidate division Zixibacteria bacterium]
MISSMTGYGRAEVEKEGRKVITEINSLNNRYRDINIRTPKSYSHYDPEIKELVQKHVKRGKILVAISVEEDPELFAARLDLDRENARMYYKVLTTLKDEFRLPGELEIGHFVNFPDLIKPAEKDDEEEVTKQMILEAVEKAVEEFLEMRAQEGGRLLDDMIRHIDKIEDFLLKAEKSSTENIRLYKEKLEERLKDLVGDMSVSQEMIANEAALVADRCDITEECVRIKSHLEMFRNCYDVDESVGKKMNFILQELYREVNTIGSKSISPDISHNVILLKEEIEKVREQVQNIE